MKTLVLALLLAAFAAPAAAQTGNEEAICRTDPNVFFCDNFEDRAVGWFGNDSGAKFKNNGYGVSEATRPVIVNTEHFDGSRSLDMETPQNQPSGGFLDTNFPGGSRRTVYYRWYSKYSSNYFWSPIATKHGELTTCGYPDTAGNPTQCGNDNGVMNFIIPGVGKPGNTYNYARDGSVSPTSYTFPQNMNVLNQLNVNQWYCFEVRITINTTIQNSDGYLQGWIDNVQRMEYPSVRLVNYCDPAAPTHCAVPSGSGGTLIPSYWNCRGDGDCSNNGDSWGNAFVHPTMHRYVDNVVASTARIGCLGASVPLTPNPPTNPRLISWLFAGLSLVGLTLLVRRP